MFFNTLGGSFSSGFGILLRTCPYTGSEMQIPPGSARGSILAARFTESPKMSESCSSTSPKCTPIRIAIGGTPRCAFRS